MLSGAGGVWPDLPLEPDASGIRHRSGVPFRRHAWTALPTTHPAIGVECEGRADRRLPRPPDHPATGAGTWLAVLHPDRGDLHQASLRRCFDQDVRQVRPDSSHRDHDQRRVLFQAPQPTILLQIGYTPLGVPWKADGASYSTVSG